MTSIFFYTQVDELHLESQYEPMIRKLRQARSTATKDDGRATVSARAT